MSVGEINDMIVQDSLHGRKKFEEVERIGNLFNRLLIFRPGMLHSTTKVFGSNNRNGRLIQVLTFSKT